MIQLLTLFRSLNLISHNYHNLTKGSTFFQDHSFFAEIYNTYDSVYDSIAERLIGLGIWEEEGVDLGEIISQTAKKVKESPKIDNVDKCFEYILEQEESICKLIEVLCTHGEYSQGTINLLAGIADESEVRQYKIKQRLK